MFQERCAGQEIVVCQKDSAVCKRQAEFFEAMFKMQKEGEMCDATLIVDAQEIYAHKVRCNSNFFPHSCCAEKKLPDFTKMLRCHVIQADFFEICTKFQDRRVCR